MNIILSIILTLAQSLIIYFSFKDIDKFISQGEYYMIILATLLFIYFILSDKYQNFYNYFRKSIFFKRIRILNSLYIYCIDYAIAVYYISLIRYIIRIIFTP